MAAGGSDAGEREFFGRIVGLLDNATLWEALRFFAVQAGSAAAGAADLAVEQGWEVDWASRVVSALVERGVLVPSEGNGPRRQIPPGMTEVASRLSALVDGVSGAHRYGARDLLEALGRLLTNADERSAFDRARRSTTAQILDAAMLRLHDAGVIDLRPSSNRPRRYAVVQPVGALLTALQESRLLDAAFLELLSRWEARAMMYVLRGDLGTEATPPAATARARTLGFLDLRSALLSLSDDFRLVVLEEGGFTFTDQGRAYVRQLQARGLATNLGEVALTLEGDRVLTALEDAVTGAAIGARHALIRRLGRALQLSVLEMVGRGLADPTGSLDQAGELVALGLLSRAGERWIPSPDLSLLLAELGIGVRADPPQAGPLIEMATLAGVSLTDLAAVQRKLLTDGAGYPIPGALPEEALAVLAGKVNPSGEQLDRVATAVEAAAASVLTVVRADYHRLNRMQREFVRRLFPVVMVIDLMTDGGMTLPSLVAEAEAIAIVRTRVAIARALYAAARAAPADLLDLQGLEWGAGLREGRLTPGPSSGTFEEQVFAAATTDEQAEVLTTAIEAASRAAIRAVRDDLARLPTSAQTLILRSLRPPVEPGSVGGAPTTPDGLLENPGTLRTVRKGVAEARRLLDLVSVTQLDHLDTSRLERLVGLPAGALTATGKPGDYPGQIFAAMTIPDHIGRLTGAVESELATAAAMVQNLAEQLREVRPRAHELAAFGLAPTLVRKLQALQPGDAGRWIGVEVRAIEALRDCLTAAGLRRLPALLNAMKLDRVELEQAAGLPPGTLTADLWRVQALPLDDGRRLLAVVEGRVSQRLRACALLADALDIDPSPIEFDLQLPTGSLVGVLTGEARLELSRTPALIERVEREARAALTRLQAHLERFPPPLPPLEREGVAPEASARLMSLSTPEDPWLTESIPTVRALRRVARAAELRAAGPPRFTHSRVTEGYAAHAVAVLEAIDTDAHRLAYGWDDPRVARLTRPLEAMRVSTGFDVRAAAISGAEAAAVLDIDPAITAVITGPDRPQPSWLIEHAAEIDSVASMARVCLSPCLIHALDLPCEDIERRAGLPAGTLPRLGEGAPRVTFEVGQAIAPLVQSASLVALAGLREALEEPAQGRGAALGAGESVSAAVSNALFATEVHPLWWLIDYATEIGAIAAALKPPPSRWRDGTEAATALRECRVPADHFFADLVNADFEIHPPLRRDAMRNWLSGHAKAMRPGAMTRAALWLDDMQADHNELPLYSYQQDIEPALDRLHLERADFEEMVRTAAPGYEPATFMKPGGGRATSRHTRYECRLFEAVLLSVSLVDDEDPDSRLPDRAAIHRRIQRDHWRSDDRHLDAVLLTRAIDHGRVRDPYAAPDSLDPGITGAAPAGEEIPADADRATLAALRAALLEIEFDLDSLEPPGFFATPLRTGPLTAEQASLLADPPHQITSDAWSATRLGLAHAIPLEVLLQIQREMKVHTRLDAISLLPEGSRERRRTDMDVLMAGHDRLMVILRHLAVDQAVPVRAVARRMAALADGGPGSSESEIAERLTRFCRDPFDDLAGYARSLEQAATDVRMERALVALSVQSLGLMVAAKMTPRELARALDVPLRTVRILLSPHRAAHAKALTRMEAARLRAGLDQLHRVGVGATGHDIELFLAETAATLDRVVDQASAFSGAREPVTLEYARRLVAGDRGAMTDWPKRILLTRAMRSLRSTLHRPLVLPQPEPPTPPFSSGPRSPQGRDAEGNSAGGRGMEW